MEKKFISSILLLPVMALTSLHNPNSLREVEAGMEFTLTILYDNYQYEEGFKNSWGFSCLIEGAGRTILFDTGGNDGNLMHNFRAAGKDPGMVDMIILSHFHLDHTGGIFEFLESRTGIEVFMPQSFPDEFKKEIESRGATPVLVSDARKITDNVWSTGEMGSEIIEQSMVLETSRGLVVITGCAHPGIEKIVEKAMEMRDRKVLLAMGGFHLFRTGTDAVEAIAREFRNKHIQYVAPSHCSGDGTIRVFKEVFGDKYVPLGTGKVVETRAL